MKHCMALNAKVGSLMLHAHATFDDALILLSGDNGSGKTTLLRCLAGLETSVQGQWQLNQQVYLDSTTHCCMPVHQRNLACVWTDAALLPWLNVQKNIMLGQRRQHASSWHDLAEVLKVSHLLSRQTLLLSSGEKQRVNLARAVYRQSNMLLLDEPFSAQAPKMRQYLRDWLKQWQRQWHIPVLMVSHDQADINNLADQHWQMSDGRLMTTNTEQHKEQDEPFHAF